ncbi:SRPBCC family protein [Bosea sp. BK604]|uniref:SRPBCC family protein n=1 Tax=Bosea sp. BK604 TaxID=2512180 RepID=UPI00104B620C|nr:SRPBCC family protein [Bosea sp. BK604]TCR60634.1 uncharacterized protein YndB with AHSA1/START domain [Bosea sp. BK604]
MAGQDEVFSYVSYIRATPDAVFEAITRPERSRQFWEHENISDWQPGSQWRHVRDNPERPVEIVGEVIEAASPHRLVTSWAAASQADDPASYSRVTYEIEDFGSLTRLTVTHDRLQSGSGMATGISRGWPLVLSSLKSFLETARGLDLAAKPKAA